MTYTKNSHCSYCGNPFAQAQPWPRTCGRCASVSYVNPLPVAVALVPIDGGLLAIRRGIQPRLGQVALPGGFIDMGESWQAAAAREVFEETQITLDPATFRPFDVLSAPDGTVLIFGLTDPVDADSLPPFTPTLETSERLVLTEKVDLAFPLHTQVAHRFLSQ